ncbi:MAG: insulinase family protein [Mariprofundaceae bacterium]|nr:insulinase family protein [Mariprofundaceae bacterium]
MFKSRFCLCVCFLLMSACVANSPNLSHMDKPLPQDPQLHVGQLENGLRYMVRQNKKPNQQVEFRLVLNVGSLQENDQQRGLAHLLEHVAFSGTKHFSKQAISAFFEKQGLEMGNDVNAHTSMDETMYRFRLLGHDEKSMDEALLLIRDWAGDLSIDADILETDKKIVLEESRLHLGLGRRVGEKLRRFEFGEAYSHTPIGKEVVIRSLTRADVLRFYREWYRPELMAVVVVGHIEPKQMIAKIKHLFADLKNPKGAPIHHLAAMDQHDSLKQLNVFDPELTQAMIRLKKKINTPFKERSEQDLQAYLMRNLYASMLNQRLRSQDLSIRSYVGAGYHHWNVNRVFSMQNLTLVAKKGTYQQSFYEVLLAFERVRRHGFQAHELARVKSTFMTKLKAMYLQRTEKKSSYYASLYASDVFDAVTQMSFADEYQYSKRLLAGIDLASINAMPQPFADQRNQSLVFLGHDGLAKQAPSKAEVLSMMAAIRAKKDVAAYVDDEVKGPLIKNLAKKGHIESEIFHQKTGVTELLLSNGARVLLKPTKRSKDSIRFHAYSRGGLAVMGGKYRAVIKNMRQVVSHSGLGRFSGVQLEKKLANKKVSLRNYVSLYHEGLKGKAIIKDIDTLFQLAHLAFTQANVDDAIFAEKRDALVDRMQLGEQTAWWKFYHAMHLKTERQDALNHHVLAKDVAQTTADELRYVLKDRFANAGDFTFQFVGAFSIARMRPLIERYLANLPAQPQREVRHVVETRPLEGHYKVTVNENLEYQSSVMIRLQSHEAYAAYKGKRFSLLKRLLRHQLNEYLREELGLIYSSDVAYRFAKEGEPYAAFMFHFDCAPEHVDQVIAGWRHVLANLRMPPSEFALQNKDSEAEDLGFIKNSMLKSIQKSRKAKDKKAKNNRYWAKKLYLLHVLDLSASRFVKSKKRLAYSQKKVASYARKYLKEDDVTIAVLNPKTGVKPKPGSEPVAASLH